MKIKLLILALLLTQILTAQQKFNILYSGGINYFIPDNKDMFDNNITQTDFPFTIHPEISENFDFAVSYQISKKVSFGTGFGLNGRAAKFDNLVLNYDSENTYKAESKIIFTYLKFPLFFEYNFLKNRHVIPYVHAEFSYNKMQCVKEEILFVETVGTEYLFKNYMLNLNPQLNNYTSNNFFGFSANVGIKYHVFEKLYFGISSGVNLSKFIKINSNVRLTGTNYGIFLNLYIIL